MTTAQDMTSEQREARYRDFLSRVITQGLSLPLERDIRNFLGLHKSIPGEAQPAVRVGWMCQVWCDNYWEPEGVITFPSNNPPKEGDWLKLSDGKDYTVGSVNPDELEIKVIPGIYPPDDGKTPGPGGEGYGMGYKDLHNISL